MALSIKFILQWFERHASIKTVDGYEDLSSDKEIFDLSNCSTKSKYYDNSSKLVIEEMKVETGGIATEEFVGLKPKMYSFLVGNSEHERKKGVNRNVVPTISHNEHKDILLNDECVNTQSIEFKVKTIEEEHMKSKKFHCLVLITKYISKAMNMRD